MSLRAAILGFLSLEPATGYTLKQRFDGSVRSFWSATQSQIYRELKTLARDGYVEFEAEPGEGKPDKKVYSLTADGRDELRQWLSEPLDPLVLRHPMLIKVVFAAELPPAELDALLERYAQDIEQTRVEYTGRLDDPRITSLARSERERVLWRLAVEHGVAWCDMQLDWVTRARRELAQPRRRRKK